MEVGPSGLILAREDLSLARLGHDCLVSEAFRQSRLWRKVARILLVLVAAEGANRRLVGPVWTGLEDLPAGVQAQMEADWEAACVAAVGARLMLAGVDPQDQTAVAARPEGILFLPSPTPGGLGVLGRAHDLEIITGYAMSPVSMPISKPRWGF